MSNNHIIFSDIESRSLANQVLKTLEDRLKK